MSAALGGEGTLDSQNVFLYGKVVDDGWGHRMEEYKRAKELCEWANGLGEGVVEGFVRMNSGFELLWCDFESESIELVSRLNVTVPTSEKPPNGSHPHHPPGQRSPFALESRWEWVRSATWHYTSPEDRVKLDYCRMTSYYNVSHPSGVKRSHRLTSITPEQAEAVKTEVVHNLLNENVYCTGIDWREVADGIARKYLERIIELRELLRMRPTPETVKRARGLSHAIVMPFLQTSDKSTEAAMERCVKEYTGRIDLSRIGNSERMLVGAVEGVMQSICKLAFGVYEDFSGPIDKEIVVNARESIGELVDWVDWAGWHRCEESCGWNEVCAVPLWPILGTPWSKGADDELWARPRCVSIEFMETGNGGWGPGRPPG
ncbi:hypothetical protein DFP73DRAFT_483166 [Morchella snyderi]|nr:hypothetical protein DFP73DRAFT_483166 [Morchella snyderi]